MASWLLSLRAQQQRMAGWELGFLAHSLRLAKRWRAGMMLRPRSRHCWQHSLDDPFDQLRSMTLLCQAHVALAARGIGC